MTEMMPLSFTLDQVRNIKINIAYGASYADRMSLGFAARLLQVKQDLGEDHAILHEIAVLEGIAPNSATKEAEQFKRPPLHPFWHKHFSTARHLNRNIGIRWGIEKGGNRYLSRMIGEVAAKYGDQSELWQKRLAHQFMIGGLEDRATAKRMTGDWIIFAKHGGQNFYLDLATHEEGQDPDRLRQKLRQGSACEFPFLFGN
jgi:hypothetical protein